MILLSLWPLKKTRCIIYISPAPEDERKSMPKQTKNLKMWMMIMSL